MIILLFLFLFCCYRFNWNWKSLWSRRAAMVTVFERFSSVHVTGWGWLQNMLECFSAWVMFYSVSAICIYHEGIFPGQAFFPSLTWIWTCEKGRNCYQYMNFQISNMKTQKRGIHWVMEHKSVKNTVGGAKCRSTTTRLNSHNSGNALHGAQ